MNGAPETIFRYKVFVDALFHSEVMSIFNLPIDNRYFTLDLLNIRHVIFCLGHVVSDPALRTYI